MSGLNYPVPDLDYMDDAVQAVISYRVCTFQLKSSHLQLQKKKCTFAPTGAGKTLTFWIPLIFNDNGIQILVTPLNILRDKNVQEIADLLSITAVNVKSATAMNELFKVCSLC